MFVRAASRWILAAAFLAAGTLHLVAPAAFLAIMPDWVPAARVTVLTTGIAEIAGAVGLMIPRLRRAAGVGLALYAVCVFPANIQHAINDLALTDPALGWAYHGPRLLFQPVIVWWALWAGEAIDWPVRRQAA